VSSHPTESNQFVCYIIYTCYNTKTMMLRSVGLVTPRAPIAALPLAKLLQQRSKLYMSRSYMLLLHPDHRTPTCISWCAGPLLLLTTKQRLCGEHAQADQYVDNLLLQAFPLLLQTHSSHACQTSHTNLVCWTAIDAACKSISVTSKESTTWMQYKSSQIQHIC